MEHLQGMKGFLMTALLLAVCLSSPLVNEGTTSFSNGLQTSVFTLPEGTITVYLPADLSAGDTISGTVVATPTGTGSQLEQNGSVLRGMVIEIAGEAPKKSGLQPTWILPASVGGIATVSLRDGSGLTKSVCHVPTMPPSEAPTFQGKFECDRVNQAGRPLHVQGPFDGDFSNTKGSVGGQGMIPIAESPRSCVFAQTPAEAGPAMVSVSDGEKSGQMPCNFVSVQLSAGKTTLLEGERTQLSLTVTGLQGLAENEFPIPCELVNRSPDVVRFGGDMGQEHAFGIEFSQVKNGVFNMSIGLVGIKPGGFGVQANIFAVKLHDLKKMMDVVTFRNWVKALIIRYQESIAQLEKEMEELKRQGRRTGGTEQKLKRHKSILQVLQRWQNANRNDVSAAKDDVDRALASDTLFSLAADLISTAADLLGYTEIPLPKVSGVLKGLKALCSKVPKAMSAIEKAEKAMEALEKAQDAKEKLEKAQEIKDALDQVREALQP